LATPQYEMAAAPCPMAAVMIALGANGIRE